MQEVDDVVNEYPCRRSFTAIGEGADDFRNSMVASVENALNTKVHPDAVLVRPSKAGKYVSVKIGPMLISNSNEVMDVFNRMQSDGRMRWFL